MLPTRVAAVLIASALIGLTAACTFISGAHEKSFDDHAAATSTDLIEQGWIPGFLPESAVDIRLKYDTATHKTALGFTYGSADHPALARACSDTPHVPSPTIKADWLPPTVALDAERSFTCTDGYLVTNGGTAYYWSREAALTINDLDGDPEQYRFLDGKTAAVIGYVDFGNIHDRRDTYYSEEVIGFVLKPGQYAEMVVGAVFPGGVDPHPLFDDIYAYLPAGETDGLRLMITGRLGLYEQPTNFTTDLGWGIDVADPADVVVDPWAER